MKFSYSRIVPCGTLFSALCALVLGHSCVYAQQAESVAPIVEPVPQLLVMATEQEQARSEMQLALQDMLLGWDESARLHFRAVLAADADCALAWCGLMMTDGATAESRDALRQWMEREDVVATPAEMELMTTLLQVVRGGRSGAGEEFAVRAEEHRHDWFSACWAILLLHDGYDSSGKALPQQQRALDLASALYERLPNNPLVAYLRAWVEEVAPVVSDEAVAAAQKAVELLPNHPAPPLLLGHLLFRRGQVKESVSFFHQAASRAGEWRQNVPHGTFLQRADGSYPVEVCPLEIRAKLYESTALWLDGQERSSLMLQADLLKKATAVDELYSAAPGAVLLHWEARSLPLRLLMLNKKLPSDAQVAAASKAALPSGASKDDPLMQLRDCLRFCVVARQRAAAGKQAQALRCVEAAEASMKRLKEVESQCRGQGVYHLSAWTRACEACSQALYAARASVYADTADIWLKSLEDVQRPASLLMPPLLPQ